MIERKSSRSRKSVDYSKFAGGEDSDDDFKDSTPPVAKRPKLSSNKENKQNDKPTQAKKDPRPKKERQSLEEKLYERELQKALELSLSQSDGSQETPVSKATEESVVTKETENTEIPILIEEDADSRAPSPILPKIDPPVLNKVTDEEEIEVLQMGIKVDDVKPSTSSLSRRKAAAKKRYVESDSDGDDPDSDFDLGNEDDDSSNDDDEDDDDDDFNVDDSDDDFGVSSKKKGKKTTSTPKPTKAARTTKPASKPAKKDTKSSTAKGSAKTTGVGTTKPLITKTVSSSPGLKKTAAFNSPAASKPVSSIAVNKTPSAGLPSRKSTNWTPPAPSSTSKSPAGGASLKSPSTGLRIGLSRNMKLKPLHPNLKIHN